MNTMNWVITAVLAAVAVYAFYVGTKKYTAYKRDVKVFMEKHPKAQEYSFSNWMFWMEVVFGALGFLLAFILPSMTETVAEQWNTRILYIALALLIIAMAMDSYVSHRILLTEDGFFYEDEYHRFRSILKLTPGSGRFKPTVVNVTNAKEIMLSAKPGTRLEEAYNEWKAQKKTSRRGRRNGK